MRHPMARSLEPIPFEENGQRLIALRDPTGICSDVCVLQPVAYVLWSLMDGKSTLTEIQARFRDEFQGSVELPLLEELIGNFDSHLILDSPTTRARLEQFPARPAAHAGSAYPSEPETLVQFLDEILDLETLPTSEATPWGMLAPHIDLRRGARSYSKSYGELRARLPATATVFVLGISHAFARTPYILTRKDFDTPLGAISTNIELVERLAKACSFDPFLDEYNHFGEHSIEFQAVFLKRLMPEGLTMVPILCGSFHEALMDGTDPRELPGVADFLNELTAIVAETPDAIVIAGADLAHVGERFGGARLSEKDLEQLDKADRESLNLVVENDQLAFFQTLQADSGSRNYCGTSAIFTMMEALDRPATLHLYEQCCEPGNVSAVTIASASLYN